MFVYVWKYLEIFGNIGLEICYLGKIIKWKMSTLPISFHIEVDHQCRCAMCPVHWWPKVHHYSEYFYIYKLISDSARYSVIKPTMWRAFDQRFSQQKISQEVEISKLKHIASIYCLLQCGHLNLLLIRFRSNISKFHLFWGQREVHCCNILVQSRVWLAGYLARAIASIRAPRRRSLIKSLNIWN